MGVGGTRRRGVIGRREEAFNINIFLDVILKAWHLIYKDFKHQVSIVFFFQNTITFVSI